MLTRPILQHYLSQQLRRNWTSSQKKKRKLLHCETTTPSNIYAKWRPDDEFIGIETNDNYNETMKFEWDLYLSVLS